MDTKLKIGIVSLGLIGGSIFKALKKHNFELFCVSSNQKTIDTVIKDGATASKDFGILKNCNIIFVCSPMRVTSNILDKLEGIISDKTIITDVCSLKEFICEKERPYVFIPSHPMAGKETSGFEVSCEDLFEGAKWVITPFEKTSQNDIEKLEEIIKLLGASIVKTTPQKHDIAVALISHMPMVLSQALVESVKDNDLAKALASSGFRDMTRLALSNTIMAQDMVELNNQNIKKSIAIAFENCQKILEDYSTNTINKIKEQRNNIYSKEGKNIF